MLHGSGNRKTGERRLAFVAFAHFSPEFCAGPSSSFDSPVIPEERE